MNQLAKDTIQENQQILTDLVVKQQYEDHIGSDGEPLRDYSPGYRLRKEKMGRSGQTDLNLSGEMQSEMEVTFIDDSTYQIDSIAEVDGKRKSEILEEWNEAPIMDLTTENIAIVREQLEPIFAERVNQELALD